MSENINKKLWYAADHGDEARVSQLIEKGAEVDWTGDDDDNSWTDGDWDSTALHQAAIGGHTPVVTRLLDSGWSLDARDSNGETPVVTRLLDSGWSLDARDSNGETPLSYAAGKGHLATANCLLLRGAHIDNQDNNNWTPLATWSFR